MGAIWEESDVVRTLLWIAVIVNFLALVIALPGFGMMGGDSLSHFAQNTLVAEQVSAGNGMLGNWCPFWNAGFPMMHYYQHISHVTTVALHFLLFKLVSLFTLQKLIVLVMLTTFPLVVYFAMRRLGLDDMAAAFAALLSVSVSSAVGYGIESYAVIGHGLYTQLFGMFLFPLAIVHIKRTLDTGEGFFLATLFLSLTFLSHLVCGYIAGLSAVLLLLVNMKEFLTRLTRLALVFVFSLISISYFIVPILMSFNLYGGLFYLPAEHMNSFGLRGTLMQLISGQLLDYAHAPFIVITLLCIAGMVVGVKKKQNLYAYVCFIFWLLMVFGRQSIAAPFIGLMPGLGSIPIFRFIEALQFFALFFAGIALAKLFRYSYALRQWHLAMKNRIILACGAMILAFITLSAVFAIVSTASDNRAGLDYDNLMKVADFLSSAQKGRVLANERTGVADVRVISLLPVISGQDMLQGFAVGALDSLTTYYTAFFNPGSAEFYNLFNVRYVLANGSYDFSGVGDKIFSAGSYDLYEVPTSGYFDLVDAHLGIYDQKSKIRAMNEVWLYSGYVENKEHLVLYTPEGSTQPDIRLIRPKDRDELLDSLGSVAVNSSCGTVGGEAVDLNRYSVEVSAARDCYLLFKMTYSPNWHFMVDGREQDSVMLSPSFMGTRMVAGEHRVEVVYREGVVSIRTMLLLAGLAILAVLLWRDHQVFLRRKYRRLKRFLGKLHGPKPN